MSLNYEKYHFKEMLAIVQEINNRGGIYTRKASECDYFIPYKLIDDNGIENKCLRTDTVNAAIENGSLIKIIEFDELLKLLDLTYEKLKVVPFPQSDAFRPSKYVSADKNQSKSIITIGEIMKAQGIDLEKMLSE